MTAARLLTRGRPKEASMVSSINQSTIDYTLFAIANLANLLTAGIFLSRTVGQQRTETILGLVFVSLALPATVAVVLNALERREWWTILLPATLIAFCIVELLLDYVFEIEFRKTGLRWPYIILYYVALISMVGYSFGIGKPYGFITLSTYMVNLGATGYAFSKGVG
jgi:hypothetical protein